MRLVGAAGLAAAGVAVWTRGLGRPKHSLGWEAPTGQTAMSALAYRQVGDGLPATVLLHGMFASGRYWGASYDRLAAEGTLLVPDLAGFGRSVGVQEGFGPKDHADLVAATLVEAGLAQGPVIVGAHSLGCLVALHLARRHPRLVAGIVALSPPLYADEARARRCLARANPLLRLFVTDPRLAEVVCRWMCRHRDLAAGLGRVVWPSLPTPLAEDRFKHTYRSYSQTLAKVIVAAVAEKLFDDVMVPVHLVAGDADRVIDLPFLEGLAQRRGDVNLSVQPKAGHELPLSHPEWCRSAIEAMQERAAVAR